VLLFFFYSAVTAFRLGALHLQRLVRKAFAVPRFFFNQIDGKHKPDDKGLEFPSLEEARTEAVQYAGEVLRHQPDVIWQGEDFRIEVTDENQLLLFTLIVVGVDAPVSGQSTNRALGPSA